MKNYPETRAAWYQRNKERVLARSKQYRKDNREKGNAVRAAYARANPERYLWSTAKARARKRLLDFTITVQDIVIPERCPILGVKLQKGGHHAPSLDRIANHRGYVPGNVAVISKRANTLKGDGNSDEHRKIADWLHKVLDTGPISKV